jgi:hypothetical protein
MAIYIEIGALLFALFILYLVYNFLKNPLLILGNSVIGIIALMILNLVFNIGIPINFWSVAIVALSGIMGVVTILILHFLGLGF